MVIREITKDTSRAWHSADASTSPPLWQLVTLAIGDVADSKEIVQVVGAGDIELFQNPMESLSVEVEEEG